MAFTSKAQLDGARKAGMGFYTNSLTLSTTTIYGFNFTNAGLLPAPVIAAPASIGSGGTLWANGDAGFAPFPQGPAALYELAVASAITVGSGVGHAAVYDFVWGGSGIVANTTSPQAVTGFPTLTRPDAIGTDLEILLVHATGAGATSTLISVDYTNSAGVAGRTATLLISPAGTTGLGSSGAITPFKLEAGDAGVQSIQGITFSVAQAAPGSFWLTLARRLAQFHVPPAEFGIDRFDAIALGLPDITDCALQFVGISGSGGSSAIPLSMTVAME